MLLKWRRFQWFGIALVAVVAIEGFLSRPPVPVTGSDAISYAEDIQPILESRCIYCHGIQWVRDGLDLRSYDSLMTGSKNGPVIIPGDAQNSYLIQRIQKGEMPKRGPKLFPAQLDKIIQWIDEGAPNN